MSKTAEIRQNTWATPAVAGNVNILAAVTLPTAGTSVQTTFVAQPDYARTIRFKGNQASVQGLQVVVVGTDVRGNALTETLTMGAAFATPTDTVNAFAAVTSITMPQRGAASDTISAGFGASLGLDEFCDAYSFQNFAGVTSYTYSATAISLNVVIPSTTMNGATAIGLVFVPATFGTDGRIWG